VLPSTPLSSNWSFSFMFLSQIPVGISFVLHTCYIPHPLFPPWHYRLNITWWGHTWWNSLLCNFLHSRIAPALLSTCNIAFCFRQIVTFSVARVAVDVSKNRVQSEMSTDDRTKRRMSLT
jgi:hypothetical protein